MDLALVSVAPFAVRPAARLLPSLRYPVEWAFSPLSLPRHTSARSQGRHKDLHPKSAGCVLILAKTMAKVVQIRRQETSEAAVVDLALRRWTILSGGTLLARLTIQCPRCQTLTRQRMLESIGSSIDERGCLVEHAVACTRKRCQPARATIALMRIRESWGQHTQPQQKRSRPAHAPATFREPNRKACEKPARDWAAQSNDRQTCHGTL